MKKQGLVEDEVLDIDGASQTLKVTKGTIYKNIEEIPHTKICGRLRFFKSDLYKYLRRD